MAQKVVTTFGLRDVALAARPSAPASTPTWIDIPSVESAAFKLAVSEVEQYGDDTYRGSFYHSQKGTITVKCNMLSTKIFEMISGNTVTSSGGVEKMYFGTVGELIPPRLMVRAIIGYRDETTGAAGQMTVYWFNCDVKTPWDSIPGGERAKLGENTLQFSSYASLVDEKGDTISGTEYAFGRFEV